MRQDFVFIPISRFFSRQRGGWGHPLSGGNQRAGWPQGIAPLGLPRIRTCPLRHTALHIMSSLRGGTLSESAVRLAPSIAIRCCFVGTVLGFDAPAVFPSNGVMTWGCSELSDFVFGSYV